MCDDVQLCNCCVHELLILARTWFTFGLLSKTGCDMYSLQEEIPHIIIIPSSLIIIMKVTKVLLIKEDPKATLNREHD
jgi:hypothetical protein